MIKIRDLSHIYAGTRKQPARTAIDRLTLDIDDGEFCILAGPNGSGKSSLFRILSGLALPSAGTVAVGGFDLRREAAKVRAIMGVVFQSPAVDKHLSVAENLAIHADLYGLGGAVLAERQEEALAWTDLRTRLGDRVDTLSGGLARQVELAKCLLSRPRLLLLDEPTTGLDPASRRSFLNALRTIQRERHMTVLMTSHIFSEAEEADKVAVMKDGKLLALDTPQALRARISREMVVVQAADPDALAARLHLEGLHVCRHGEELRLDETRNGESLPLLERILARYRDQVVSISIKQADLEDVFIHLTTTPPDELAALGKDMQRTGT